MRSREFKITGVFASFFSNKVLQSTLGILGPSAGRPGVRNFPGWPGKKTLSQELSTVCFTTSKYTSSMWVRLALVKKIRQHA